MITEFELGARWNLTSDNVMWIARAKRDDFAEPLYCCRYLDIRECEYIAPGRFFALLEDMAADIGRYKGERR